MEDVISYMLEAEREANAIVEAAEKEAEETRRAGHEAAQEILDEAKREAQGEARELIAVRKEQALARKEQALAEFEVELQALRDAAEKRLGDAVVLAGQMLSATAANGPVQAT